MGKVILFDFDGTIADSFDSFLDIVHVLSKKHHFSMLTREEVEQLRSEEIPAVMKRLKIPFYKLLFLGRDMKKLQQQQISQIKPFVGLPDILHKLAQEGYELGILTSNGKENVEAFIKKNNIDVFRYIYTDTSVFGKDKTLRKFLKQHGVSPEEVTYVGDEIRDIQACQKVGVKIVSVAWGFNTKDGLLKYHPDFLINKPEELLEVLKK